MGIANKLTLLRLVMIPVMIVLMLTGHNLWAAWVFIAACVTDIADGYLARRLGEITTFGIFFDPLADKLLVSAAAVLMVEQGVIPGWTVIVILMREFAVSGLRMLAAERNTVIAAAVSGKLKTLTQDLALGLLLIFAYTEGTPDFFTVLAYVIYYISLAMAVISGAEYFIKNKAAFAKR